MAEVLVQNNHLSHITTVVLGEHWLDRRYVQRIWFAVKLRRLAECASLVAAAGGKQHAPALDMNSMPRYMHVRRRVDQRGRLLAELRCQREFSPPQEHPVEFSGYVLGHCAKIASPELGHTSTTGRPRHRGRVICLVNIE